MAKLNIAVLLLFISSCVTSYHVLKRKHGLPPVDPPQSRARNPVLNTISQRVDHFNPRDTRTWAMRYYSNDQFYSEGGPIFIMIGGEWDIDPGWLMGGLMFDMAAEHGGALFYTEHRYYGYSHPTEDHSPANLRYLSIDQSLADLAYFIEYQKELIAGASNSKVAIVGGSYAGTMATWMRMKYPHLIDAAWASSAPLRATADFYEYYQHIGQEIRRVDESCYQSIEEAMQEIVENLETPTGVQEMSELFNTCAPIDTSEPEISYFFAHFANPWAGAIQYADGSPAIQAECDYFKSFGTTSFDRMVGYMRAFFEGWCMDNLADFLAWYEDYTLTSGDDWVRQWVYQCCSEYGWWQSGSGDTPFAYFSNQFFLGICDGLFSIDDGILDTAVNRTNLFYGSVYPEVTRLVSVHGSIDPWMVMGVSSDINEQAPVIIVPEAAHCADMGSISPDDSEEMIAAKTRVMALIREWIS